MHLYLENRWLYLSVLDNVNNLNTANVAHTDVSYEAVSHELFHSFPSLLVGNSVVGFHSWICRLRVMNPLWGISYSRVNVFERDWEMNQVEVNIV